MPKTYKYPTPPEPIEWQGIPASDMLDIMQNHLIEVTYNSESKVTVTLMNYCDHGTIVATADSIYKAFCAWARKYNKYCEPYKGDPDALSDDPDYPNYPLSESLPHD